MTGDTKYGTVENIVAIEDQRHPRLRPAVGGRPAAGPVRATRTSPTTRRPTPTAVPGTQTLRFLSQCDAHAAAGLRGAGGGLPRLRAQARSAPPRSGGGGSGAASTRTYLERVRGYHATEPYAKAMRKRKVWVEPLFAEAKDWHGLRRFRLRGLEKVNGEALLIAAGQNLKRLLSRWGWGRRPWPSGAAGVVLPAAQPVAVSPW